MCSWKKWQMALISFLNSKAHPLLLLLHTTKTIYYQLDFQKLSWTASESLQLVLLVYYFYSPTYLLTPFLNIIHRVHHISLQLHEKSFNPTRCQMKMFSSNRILFTKGRSSTKRRQSVFWTRNKTPPPTLLELLRRFHKKRAFWRRLKTRYSFTFWKRRTKLQTGMLNPRRCSWLLLLSDYQSHKRADNITKRRH